jgi:hypothetical protein
MRALLLHRRTPLVAAVIVLGVMLARDRLRPAPYREVGMEEVAARLGRPGVHPVDANATEIFEEAHLPGAIHVNALRFTAAELPPDRGATLVFYCKNPH